MAVALVTDAHLGGPGGEAEPLAAQLLALPTDDCHHVILLGDLCQVWIGDRRFETQEIARLVEAVRHLRARGMRVDYVEGNRDFFLADGDYADVFDHVTDEIAFEVDGVRYLAVHGDDVNAGDTKYRLWRAVSKSRLSRFFMRHLPTWIARRLIHGTERRLDQSNFKHKMRIPKSEILRYARRRLAEGFDVLLLGHFHEPHTWSTDSGEVRLLDAWFRSHRIEWFGRRAS
jgi:UDP-2,3-diacylglucosamine pyrophosphatase LpxH